jgi:aromatic-amino-acid transaminase
MMSLDLRRRRNGPRDPILGLNEAFNADTRATKVNLGVGVYLRRQRQDPAAGPPSRPPKRPASKPLLRAATSRSKASPPTTRRCRTCSSARIPHCSPNGKVVTIEALGGTGALKVGADYLKRLNAGAKVYISDPSWENHRALFESAGFRSRTTPTTTRHPRRELRRHEGQAWSPCRPARSSCCTPAATTPPAPT